MNLSTDTFDKLFPFHIEVGADSRISGLGKSIQKTCPDLEISQNFAAAFTPFRPSEAFDLRSLREQTQTLFVIKAQKSGLSLRGQIVPTDDGGFVFLGSPWFSDSTELGRRGLTVEDFAIHDPAVDLLHILRAQQMATNDLKRLTEKLRGQRTQLKTANTRLIEQEAEQRRLALIAERTDNGVILTDAEGRTQWVNAGFTRLTGYTLEEVKGKVPGNFLQGPGTNHETVEFIRSQILERKPFRAEILNYHKSGRRYWVEFEVQPIFDDEGELLHFMAIENDTTSQRAAEANRRAQFKVSQLLTQASDFEGVAEELLAAIGSELLWDGGVLWMAKEGDSSMESVSFWTQSPSTHLHNSGDRLTSTDLLAGEAWSEGAFIWIEDLVEVPTKTPRIEELLEQGFRSALVVPIRIGENTLGVLELFGRLAESKDNELEQVLTAISSQIAQFVERKLSEKELKTRSEELSRLNRELSAASQAKDKFLASMSHEIRTPLNGVIGAADSLEVTRLDPDQKEALSTITSSASHLHSLLNDVLDLARIEAGHLELNPEPTILTELIDGTARMFQPIAKEKDLRFEVESTLNPSLSVDVDQTRLRQVLVNLLGNAFKFTPSGGVKLSIRHRTTGQNVKVDFSVIDTGIGIPGDQVDQLFQPFQQLDSSRTKKFGGTGLGLTICQQLVSMMKGEIFLKPSPTQGSTFQVSLNLPLAKKPKKQISESLIIALPDPVLVVDDNPANARVISMMLKRVGIKTHHCQHAVDAMAYCAEIEPPIILMDLHMPDIDGVSATRMLREEVLINPGRHVPIVALTADVRPEAKQNCLEAGMDGFLSKPIRLEDLIRTLREHLDIPDQSPDNTIPQPQKPVSEKMPDLDYDFSERVFGDQPDPEFKKEVRDLFSDVWKDLEPALQEIATFQKSADLSAGQKKCHGVKGIVANFGLSRAAQILGEMEQRESAFNDTEMLTEIRTSLDNGHQQLLQRYPFLKS
ncbi:MAG: hypothetical protein SynsKO_00240 [Synoicihabitans sp.]